MTAQLKALVERVAAEHAASYVAEFGEPISTKDCGDWDAESLGVARTHASGAGFYDELEDEDVYEEFRSTYFATLFVSAS